MSVQTSAPSEFARVVSAIIAALATAPAVCDTIYRARPDIVPDQVAQAVNVEWIGFLSDVGAIFGAPEDLDTRITVDCYASGMGDSGDLLVDPLLVAVRARLRQDSTLGGTVAWLQLVGGEAESTSAGKKTGWVRLTYRALHRADNLTES